MGTGQDFARNLRSARERHEWSPTELARRCQAQGLTGFYAATVNRVEAGTRQIRLEEAPALANVFHLTVEQMMFDAARFDVVMRFSVLVERMTALGETLRIAGAEYEEARQSTATSLLATAGFDDRMALTSAQKDQLELLAHQTAGEIAMGQRPQYQVDAEDALYEKIYPSDDDRS